MKNKFDNMDVKMRVVFLHEQDLKNVCILLSAGRDNSNLPDETKRFIDGVMKNFENAATFFEFKEKVLAAIAMGQMKNKIRL